MQITTKQLDPSKTQSPRVLRGWYPDASIRGKCTQQFYAALDITIFPNVYQICARYTSPSRLRRFFSARCPTGANAKFIVISPYIASAYNRRICTPPIAGIILICMRRFTNYWHYTDNIHLNISIYENCSWSDTLYTRTSRLYTVAHVNITILEHNQASHCGKEIRQVLARKIRSKCKQTRYIACYDKNKQRMSGNMFLIVFITPLATTNVNIDDWWKNNQNTT